MGTASGSPSGASNKNLGNSVMDRGFSAQSSTSRAAANAAVDRAIGTNFSGNNFSAGGGNLVGGAGREGGGGTGSMRDYTAAPSAPVSRGIVISPVADVVSGIGTGFRGPATTWGTAPSIVPGSALAAQNASILSGGLLGTADAYRSGQIGLNQALSQASPFRGYYDLARIGFWDSPQKVESKYLAANPNASSIGQIDTTLGELKGAVDAGLITDPQMVKDINDAVAAKYRGSTGVSMMGFQKDPTGFSDAGILGSALDASLPSAASIAERDAQLNLVTDQPSIAPEAQAYAEGVTNQRINDNLNQAIESAVASINASADPNAGLPPAYGMLSTPARDYYAFLTDDARVSTPAQQAMVDALNLEAYKRGDVYGITELGRDSNTGLHPRGLAMDFSTYDPVTGQPTQRIYYPTRGTGKAFGGTEVPADESQFRNYEQIAQGMQQNLSRSLADRQYGQYTGAQLGDALRWGGYFSGRNTNNPGYGALDLMHVDLGGLEGRGTALGNLEAGLNPNATLWTGRPVADYFPNIQSAGLLSDTTVASAPAAPAPAPAPAPMPTIQDAQAMAPDMLSEYNSLIRAGVSPEVATQLVSELQQQPAPAPAPAPAPTQVRTGPTSILPPGLSIDYGSPVDVSPSMPPVQQGLTPDVGYTGPLPQEKPAVPSSFITDMDRAAMGYTGPIPREKPAVPSSFMTDMDKQALGLLGAAAPTTQEKRDQAVQRYITNFSARNATKAVDKKPPKTKSKQSKSKKTRAKQRYITNFRAGLLD